MPASLSPRLVPAMPLAHVAPAPADPAHVAPPELVSRGAPSQEQQVHLPRRPTALLRSPSRLATAMTTRCRQLPQTERLLPEREQRERSPMQPRRPKAPAIGMPRQSSRSSVRSFGGVRSSRARRSSSATDGGTYDRPTADSGPRRPFFESSLQARTPSWMAWGDTPDLIHSKRAACRQNRARWLTCGQNVSVWPVLARPVFHHGQGSISSVIGPTGQERPPSLTRESPRSDRPDRRGLRMAARARRHHRECG